MKSHLRPANSGPKKTRTSTFSEFYKNFYMYYQWLIKCEIYIPDQQNSGFWPD